MDSPSLSMRSDLPYIRGSRARRTTQDKNSNTARFVVRFPVDVHPLTPQLCHYSRDCTTTILCDTGEQSNEQLLSASARAGSSERLAPGGNSTKCPVLPNPRRHLRPPQPMDYLRTINRIVWCESAIESRCRVRHADIAS